MSALSEQSAGANGALRAPMPSSEGPSTEPGASLNAVHSPRVGIAEIDRQYGELAGRLSRLREGIVNGDRSEVSRMLDFLNGHVLDHFGLEERWMVERGYPDQAAHKAEHDAFIQEYLRFLVQVERRGSTALVAMRMSNWLADWLDQHVGSHDESLGDYLRRNCPEPG